MISQRQLPEDLRPSRSQPFSQLICQMIITTMKQAGPARAMTGGQYKHKYHHWARDLSDESGVPSSCQTGVHLPPEVPRVLVAQQQALSMTQTSSVM